MLPDTRHLLLPHPLGEVSASVRSGQIDSLPVQLPGGVFQVRIDPDAQVSQQGGMVPFAQFLEASGVLSAWERDCPLYRTSPNASSARAVLGTWVVAVTGGQ